MAGKVATKGTDAGSGRSDGGTTVALDYAGRPKKTEGCNFLGAGFFLVLFVVVLTWLIRDSRKRSG